MAEFTNISVADENAILSRGMLQVLDRLGGRIEIDLSKPIIAAGILIARTGEKTVAIIKIESGTIN